MKQPKTRSQTPCDYTIEDVGAIQALMKGEAEPHQQKRALDWLINTVCITYDATFDHNQAEYSHAEGRRYVGNTIIKMLKLNIAKLKEGKKL